MNKKILIIGIITLLVDQFFKIIVGNYIKYDEIISVIDDFFYLTNVFNTGAAFSLFENKTFLLIIISVVACLIIYKYVSTYRESVISNLGFGLIYGGLFGNLLDRVFFGYVRDFLKFNIFGYNYPIFNIADSCLVIGIILIIICTLRGDDNESSSKLRR